LEIWKIGEKRKKKFRFGEEECFSERLFVSTSFRTNLSNKKMRLSGFACADVTFSKHLNIINPIPPDGIIVGA
jgi:hypothetical protein